MSEFIVLGFSTFLQQLLPAFFLPVLLMHLFTLLGNLLITDTVWSECSLHTPVCLFLRALSISEVFYTVTTTLRVLADLLSAHRSISSVACAGQIFFSFTFGVTHSFLLTALDSHLSPGTLQHAHETPWLYHLVAWSWGGGLMLGMMVTLIVCPLTFSGSPAIHHFLCHVLSLLKLVCGEEISLVTVGVILGCITDMIKLPIPHHLLLCLPCGCHPTDPYAEGWHQAFSTHVSHLTVVVMHCGFASIFYLRPKGAHAVDINTLMASLVVVLGMLGGKIGISRKGEDKAQRRSHPDTVQRKSYPNSAQGGGPM